MMSAISAYGESRLAKRASVRASTWKGYGNLSGEKRVRFCESREGVKFEGVLVLRA